MVADARGATDAQSPADEDLERFARELLAEGHPEEVAELLSALAVNLARHEVGLLPCLCRRCGEQAFDVDVGGELFFRDFVVSMGHVLPYWAPVELRSGPRLRRLRASMRAALLERLVELRTAARIALLRRANEASSSDDPGDALEPPGAGLEGAREGAREEAREEARLETVDGDHRGPTGGVPS
jgi:hypothetical protein